MANGALVLGETVSRKPSSQSLGMIACVLLIVAVFTVDLLTPREIAVPFLYALVVGGCLWWATSRQTVAVVGAIFVLIVIGFVLSPGGRFRVGLVNDGIALLTLALLAYSGFSYRRAVDKLRQREGELTDFVENAAVGMNWVGPDGTILWANQEELNMLGYKREEYIGHPIAEFFADREAIDDMLARLSANVTLKGYEARLRHQDGSLRHVVISANAYFVDGRFIHTRCFTRDVSDRVRAEQAVSESRALAAVNAQLRAETIERKAAEQALREREELLRVTFDTAPVAIDVVSTEGTFLKWNTAYQRMLGYTEEELRHRKLLEWTHQDDVARSQTLREELLQGKRDSYELEKRIWTKDGRLIWVHIKVSAVNDDFGKPRFTVCVGQDITERKRAERTLEESEERYRYLFESNPVPMWIRRDDTLQIVTVNEAAVELYGYTRDEFDRMTSFDLQAADYLAAYKTLVRERPAGISTHHHGGRHRKKDGSIIDVNVTSRPLSYAGASARLVLAQDITRRKAAEEALRRSEEQFFKIFRESPVAISIATLNEGRLIDVNDRYLEMFGYQRDEVIGHTSLDLGLWVNPEQRAALRMKINAGVPVRNVEMEFRRKSGETGIALFWREIVHLRDGPVGFAMRVDITERKRAEQDLERKTALAQLLESLARAANEVQTPDEAMQLCVERICRHGGWVLGRLGTYPPGEAKIFPLDSAWYDTQPGRFAEFKATSIEKRKHLLTGGFITAVVRENKPLWLEDIARATGFGRQAIAGASGLRSAFAFPVSAGGEVLAFLEFYADEPRPANALLMEASVSVGSMLARLLERGQASAERERLARIVEDSGAAIWSRTADDTLISWNTAAERLFGWTREEALGTQDNFLVPPERLHERHVIPERLAHGEDSIVLETVRLRKDGTPIDVELRASVTRDASRNVIWTAFIVHDITERKRAERALSESREYYRQLFDSNPMPMWIADYKTREFLDVNQAAISKYGHTREEFLHMTTFDIRPPEDVAAYRAFLQQRTSSTEVVRRRARHRRKDGGIIAVETIAYPHHYAGRPARLVLIDDVTERLAAEKALTESEERFRAAFDQAAVGMALRNIEPRSPRWLRVNRKMCDIFGYTHEEFLQMTAVEVTAPEEQATASEYINRIERGEISSYTREKRYVRKNGEVFWANLSVSVVRGPDGHATQTIAAIQDITEKKRSVDAIHDMAMRQRSIAKLGVYAVTDTDLQKIMDRAVMVVRDTLGASHVKVLRSLPDGKSLLLVSGTGWKNGSIGTATVPAESESQAGYTLARGRVTAEGETRYEPVIVKDFHTETRFRAPSLLKEHAIRSGMSVPIYGAGAPFGVFGVHSAALHVYTAQDAQFLEAVASVLAAAIQRAENYEQIRQSREQLRALAGQMVKVREDERLAIAREVHDELGQVLTAMKIDAALLTETIDRARRLPRQQIREELASLMGTMDQAIQSVRKISTALRPVLLDELGFVAAFEWQSRDFEKRHHIRCTVTVADPITEPSGDAAIALFRIFQEALMNVVRHSGARDVVAEFRQEGNDLVLRVRDDGKGMPAFSRTSSRTLGLAGMRERAMMFGGEVKFESAKDRGTTVTARIPTNTVLKN